MHRNAMLLERLFEGLKAQRHDAMAACYLPAASFQDIAFDLRSGRDVHAMWHMISDGDIALDSWRIEAVDGTTATVVWTAHYSFPSKPPAWPFRQRVVHNATTSHFTFAGGRILRQVDTCDAAAWGRQALGPVFGALVTAIPQLRRWLAASKLRRFIAAHPQYAADVAMRAASGGTVST